MRNTAALFEPAGLNGLTRHQAPTSRDVRAADQALTVIAGNGTGPTREPQLKTSAEPEVPVSAASMLAIRLLDIIVAALALILLAPLLLVVAAIIRTSGTGPVLFRQQRIGQNGTQFTCLKFRTMRVDADHYLNELLSSCPSSRQEWEQDQKLRNDPRVTPFGSFLRRSSIDELPQLFNVIAGDMSIVGPRPIVAGEAPRYGRYIRYYQATRPGITGLWQISGRNDTTYRRRIACDILYLRSRSVETNLKIMMRTVPVVLQSRGAY
jgi:lipopolysaccharide/colanic/teichoic acid biosynthesis glycosyltransferase